jgi:hypothetical protein
MRVIRAVRLVAILACGLFALSACSTDSRYLPALLDDPMAVYEADGITLVHSADTGRGKSFVTGKPVHAKVVRRFRLSERDDMDQVFASAIAAAEIAGWEMRDLGPSDLAEGGQGISASKQFDWGPGRLTIVVSPTPGEPHGEIFLGITLDE